MCHFRPLSSTYTLNVSLVGIVGFYLHKKKKRTNKEKDSSSQRKKKIVAPIIIEMIYMYFVLSGKKKKTLDPCSKQHKLYSRFV